MSKIHKILSRRVVLVHCFNCDTHSRKGNISSLMNPRTSILQACAIEGVHENSLLTDMREMKESAGISTCIYYLGASTVFFPVHLKDEKLLSIFSPASESPKAIRL